MNKSRPRTSPRILLVGLILALVVLGALLWLPTKAGDPLVDVVNSQGGHGASPGSDPLVESSAATRRRSEGVTAPLEPSSADPPELGGGCSLVLLFLGVPLEALKEATVTTTIAIRPDLTTSWDMHPTSFQEVKGKLREDGALVFSGLAPGIHRVGPDSMFRVAGLRWEPQVVTIAEGETKVLELKAEYPRQYRFTLMLDTLEPEAAKRLGWHLEAFGRGSRSPTYPMWQTVVRRSLEASVVLTLHKEPIEWRASLSGRRGRPLVPTQSTVVVTPASTLASLARDHSSRQADVDAILDVPVILLNIDRKGRLATVVGKMDVAAGAPRFGLEVVGRSIDGLDFAEMVRVEEDGGFTFSADLGLLSGAEVSLRSSRFTDQLGPFKLSAGTVDWGVLMFQDEKPRPDSPSGSMQDSFLGR